MIFVLLAAPAYTDFMIEDRGHHLCTVGGILLFGGNPNRWLPQAGITAIAFETTERMGGNGLDPVGAYGWGGAYGSVYTQGLLIVEIRDAVSGLLLIRLADRTRADHELTGEAIRDTRLRADTGIVVERWVGGIREALANARIASQPSRAQD